MSDPSLNDTTADLALREKELRIAEGRLKLDSSFPKKWGAPMFGAFATVCVALFSGASSFVQTQTLQHAEREQATRLEQQRAIEIQRLEAQSELENSRLALDMYFKNIELLREEDERSVRHLALIAEISGNPSIKQVFLDIRNAILQSRRTGEETIEISEVVRSLPILTAERSYDAGDLTAWIHYPNESTSCQEQANSMRSTLESLGVHVPAIEGIGIGDSPDNSDLRFYSTQQSESLQDLMGTFSSQHRTINLATQILDDAPPTNFVEIWLGENDCP